MLPSSITLKAKQTPKGIDDFLFFNFIFEVCWTFQKNTDLHIIFFISKIHKLHSTLKRGLG